MGEWAGAAEGAQRDLDTLEFGQYQEVLAVYVEGSLEGDVKID